MGINSNANSLALNTYFKKKRRIATGLVYTIIGLGPIIMPQIIAFILPLYEVDGTLLLYTGLSLCAAMFAMLFQPVEWHVKKQENLSDEKPASTDPADPTSENDVFSSVVKVNGNFILSQRSDSMEKSNRSNSLMRIDNGQLPMVLLAKPVISDSFYCDEDARKGISIKPPYATEVNRLSTHNNATDNFPSEERHPLYVDPHAAEKVAEVEMKAKTLWQTIVISFDLNLLHDLTYVNLLMGITLGNFAEMNFAILTPFVLADWKFTKREIATIMSILGGFDIGVRFFIAIIGEKIAWDNKTFYLVGIMGMAMGRVCKSRFKYGISVSRILSTRHIIHNEFLTQSSHSFNRIGTFWAHFVGLDFAKECEPCSCP